MNTTYMHLYDANRDRAAAEAAVALAVSDARAEGWTWQQIGDVLGVSRQAAQQRYGA